MGKREGLRNGDGTLSSIASHVTCGKEAVNGDEA